MVSALLVFISVNVAAQRNTMSGYVTDAESGEPLIGVAVIDKATSSGTMTGNSGFYSISLPSGQRTFVVSCLGYEEMTLDIDLTADRSVNMSLNISKDLLSEAVVTASRSEAGVLGTQMSAIEVPVSQIKAIPAIGGEVDVIKALQLLPGVQSGTEGSAGIYVRGGGADENLLLMDGVPLYNVSHLLGFFSVFNADAVKNVTLYKGSFPARFGGHLSSVIDIRMNDGNDSEFHGNASIGLISSKINLEGPIVKGRTTFNVSARRTYLDLLAKPVIAYVNKENNNTADDYEKYGGGYDFYDLNAKITHRFNNDDRLSLSFYSGDDNAHVKVSDGYRYNDVAAPGSELDVMNRNETGLGWKWGNLVTALRWNHELTPTIYMSTAASYTQYRSHLGLSLSEKETYYEKRKEVGTSSEMAAVDYNSLINDISGTVDFEWKPVPEHDVKFGATYTYHNFKPGIISASEKASYDFNPEENVNFKTEVGDKPLYSHEAALFAEDNYSITDWLKVNAGLRTSLYNVTGKTYFSAEPRLSARALITDDLSVKLSYSEMSQYIHLLCNSSLSLPSDLWVPVTKNILPMRSRQTAAGVFYDWGRLEFSVEGYYKTMENVLEYKDGASYLGTSTGWENKVCMGRGIAYGIELFAQKKFGKTTGWIGYTWSHSKRIFDREGNIINDGRPFPAKYDRRHDLSATVTHTFSKKFDLSASFILSSGNCGSLGFDEYPAYDLSEDPNGTGHEFIGVYNTVTYLPNRNNYRMPLYNRMDIGMNFYRQKKHGTAVWNLSVYNVYNRLNPFIILLGNNERYDSEKDRYLYDPVLKQISIFPILPSFSYTFKF